MSQWKMNNYQAVSPTPRKNSTRSWRRSRRGRPRLPLLHAPLLAPGIPGLRPHLAGWVKKLSGRPTVTVGSVGLDNEFIGTFKGEQSGVTGVERLLDRMERDEFDLVAVGRALLGDPEWATKVFEGRTDELLPFDASMLRTLS